MQVDLHFPTSRRRMVSALIRLDAGRRRIERLLYQMRQPAGERAFVGAVANVNVVRESAVGKGTKHCSILLFMWRVLEYI